MAKVLVIGASGKIGRLLVAQLVETKHQPVALVRNKYSCTFPDSVDVIEGDLEQDITHALQGCSVVVFTAGSGANTGLDKTLLVDLWGACNTIDTAEKSAVEQFIMVSSRGADDPDLGPKAIKPYLVAKHFADRHLIESKFNYTILRPGRLTDEVATGLVKTSRPTDPNDQRISREDAANTIMQCILNDRVFNKVFELYEGREKLADLIR